MVNGVNYSKVPKVDKEQRARFSFQALEQGKPFPNTEKFHRYIQEEIDQVNDADKELEFYLNESDEDQLTIDPLEDYKPLDIFLSRLHMTPIDPAVLEFRNALEGIAKEYISKENYLIFAGFVGESDLSRNLKPNKGSAEVSFGAETTLRGASGAEAKSAVKKYLKSRENQKKKRERMIQKKGKADQSKKKENYKKQSNKIRPQFEKTQKIIRSLWGDVVTEDFYKEKIYPELFGDSLIGSLAYSHSDKNVFWKSDKDQHIESKKEFYEFREDGIKKIAQKLQELSKQEDLFGDSDTARKRVNDFATELLRAVRTVDELM